MAGGASQGLRVLRDLGFEEEELMAWEEKEGKMLREGFVFCRSVKGEVGGRAEARVKWLSFDCHTSPPPHKVPVQRS